MPLPRPAPPRCQAPRRTPDRAHHGRPWTLRARPVRTWWHRLRLLKRARDPEADSVVPVVGGVPVALGRAEILRIVVPGTAAQDTATRGRPGFRGSHRMQTSCLTMAQASALRD